MTEHFDTPGDFSDEMAEYLQIFLDETEEQLDDLVETMLALEQDPTSGEHLNEAFRLIHSIKGSAGMMGFDTIMALTHQLESRFARFRSGIARLDDPTMSVVLRCIDYLRQCNQRLRGGQKLGSSVELLDDLKRIEELTVDSVAGDSQRVTAEDTETEPDTAPRSQSSDAMDLGEAVVRMTVRFRAGLPLADLKAQLIVTRLGDWGHVQSTRPELDQLSDTEPIREFEVRIVSHANLSDLRAAAEVDGVESIDFIDSSPETVDPSAAATADGVDNSFDASKMPDIEGGAAHNSIAGSSTSTPPEAFELAAVEPSTRGGQAGGGGGDVAPALSEPSAKPEPSADDKASPKVAETMRVEIERLDSLMNLTGELVVNRARFVQISGQISPALRTARTLDRVRDFRDLVCDTIERMENAEEGRVNWAAQIQQLRAGLELMDEQSEVWHNGHHCLSQIGEAIDQLSRVSHSLQRGVLDIRMVPVAPLFNRFRRVVRDLSKEGGKKVNLLIRGEKTELDKRMIDELGDPLVHLVRNSIDHGLESPEIRSRRGKPEIGTICLEASHSGNNVYIRVQDDGGGINVEKIKHKLIDQGILPKSAVSELSDEQALEYIWHPGFSTAKAVTNVSGRGVGMDVVKTRINHLNGTIEVDSTPQLGTVFTMRLPLTLAIISSLLVRMRNVVFSIPMDDVREIVSVDEREVVTVCGKQTFDVRDEYIPLVGIKDVFRWHEVDYGYRQVGGHGETETPGSGVEVVILLSGGRTLGLRVDELLGSQDIVIKSLSDNFMSLRGLSGASILGDGSVCLMLDVNTVIDMASGPTRALDSEELPS